MTADSPNRLSHPSQGGLDLEGATARFETRVANGMYEDWEGQEILALLSRVRELEAGTTTLTLDKIGHNTSDHYARLARKQEIIEESDRIIRAQGVKIEALQSAPVREAAVRLQGLYAIKRPKPWQGDDGALERLWDAIDALRAALADSEEGRGLIQSRNPFSPKGRVVAPLDEEGG